MPLVRFQVRNEFSLGQPQLYKEVNREDPKAVLDGVAVAGLVGILRQLGDLAEFAAEVFHGLQEQVMTTASRSQKLMVRVQHIEAALPPLEKAVLAQTSHIHFAYTSGLEWHPHIRNEKNHFIYNDLPRFIMDSYEECQDPPRLYLLDKFDTGGPGSCLKRYSDPTFFKKASANPDEANVEQVRRSRKGQRSKKRGSQRNGDVSRGASVSNRSSRMQYIPPITNGRSSSSPTASTADMALKSDLGDNSISFDSKTESEYIEFAAHPSSSLQAEEQESKESPSSKSVQNDALNSVLPDDQTGFVDNSPGSSLQDQVTSGSSGVNWDEKVEIVDPKGQQNCIDETTEMLLTKDDLDANEGGAGSFRIVEQMDVLFDDENILEPSRNQIDEIESEPDNFMDALNTIESESENDLDCQTKREVEHFASVVNNKGPDGVHEITMDCSDHQTPTLESHTAISYVSSEEETPTDLSNSTSPECPAHKQMPQIATELSNSDHIVETNRTDIFDCSRLESVSGDSTSSGSGTTNAQDKTISSLCEARQSPADVSRNNSTSFGSGTTNEQDNLISSLCEAQESPADISRNNTTSFGSGTTNEQDKIISSLCEAQESPADISRNNITSFGSGTTNEQDKIISSLCEAQESPADISRNNTTSCGSGISNVKDKIISGLCESQESLGDISRNNSTSCGSGTANAKDKIISGLCESQESLVDISRTNSINFWTNGGLLGLQPSKPPDFTMSSPITQDSAYRSTETVGDSNHAYTLIADEHEAENAGCKEISSDYQEDGISPKEISKGFSSTELYPKLGNIGDSPKSNVFSHCMEDGLKKTNTTEPRTLLPVAPCGKSTSNEANQENDENSSLVFGLGRRLLVNGFGRKVPHSHDDKSEPASYSNAGVLDQRNEHHRVEHQAFPDTSFKEKFEHGFAVESPPSSPPLEHMKISFHPMNGIETSILKLKLSDGSQSHGSVKDMFQSFQLVPEPSIPLHEFGSDSDDDTFCRSSPYISDDCLSHLSESNSEQWESRETLECKNHDLYDALCGIASAECISTSLEVGGISHNATYGDGGIQSVHTDNGLEHSLSDPLLDLPSLDALEPVLQQEAKDDSVPKDLHGLKCSGDSTPGPPPLPPVEWRVSKPTLNVTDEKQDVSEGFKHVFDTEILGPLTLQQPKPAPAQQQQINEESISIKPKCKEDQHVNGQKEADQALNGKGIDEKEDFLQQIRAKSFNLRRTVPAKPTITPVSATNVKVTAILEKANAIRQAVGSDEGEDDDTWSDA
ncbi:protein SCAR3 isoform X2 [Prunus dulcis]|uniref:protein SCAR3 isoform X2 n=1 Tax=Prunus dulcis TaxID=3755 RepID=UPI001482E021|nr:protein SCAR3 isoform X2 [Prunus dulcis]